ncbi:hypothetical protein [Amycolatopsis regifaucium]|uniref:Uncharacterized protein n=1 Tax=Amycolatopsis regifaucium TaxID=546365 RepID=A0A154M8K8_9PSEU|nr:hypothetical protein [Amycolatopsis regifaucium]KZB80886.1 hypothetical protein AVL48_37845 [Amycolatopsis regifaucium]OKA03096.1 hypothetical protein ATP06_0238020 [Amycolatopsis regifaucium]SFJ73557.1 hypothetical protein SAMN04489731_13521 [Amycolatopsis regifaucium]
MWSWLLASPVAATGITAITRCILAKIRAESRRRELEIALNNATPAERVAILRALCDQPSTPARRRREADS